MIPSVRVGTSGYSYFWNEGKPSPFEWYLRQGFNTVEINASFYRFPSTSWVRTWMKAPTSFDFSMKVHRSITHYRRLGEASVELFERFQRPLEPMTDRITFWLFQMPPSFSCSERNLERIEVFLNAVELGSSAVLEFRHPLWWERLEEVRRSGAAFCSVDAPGLPGEIITLNQVMYLRLHGRTSWYDYVYSEEELLDIVEEVSQSPAPRRYIYLNNDHGMLPNGAFLLDLFGASKGSYERTSEGN